MTSTRDQLRPTVGFSDSNHSPVVSEPKSPLRPPHRNHLNGQADAIPDIVIRRLPIYVRTLRELHDRGVESVSSDELAAMIGVTAAQIRRDLSYFGKFGKQGKGYDTIFVADSIAKILRLDRQWDAALAGFGNLGRAIAHYRGFALSSFHIAAIFDRNEDHIGSQVNGLTIYDDSKIEEVISELKLQIGIIAVPGLEAQSVANRMISAGVQAILNYAPVVLRVPSDVTVREVDPIAALQSMTYYLPVE
jgi:redox-sensing transcriptional repressor